MNQIRAFAAALAALALSACGLVSADRQATFIVVDVSGTYFQELDTALRAARMLVADLEGGDRLTLAEIGSCSFSDDAVVFDARVPDRPSDAARMKRAALARIDVYAEQARRSEYTDINGALIRAAYQLQRTEAERKIIIIFSDLVEDPEPGCATGGIDVDLTGVTVIAANVITLRSDTQNPRAYFERLAAWEARINAAGGDWLVAEDLDALQAHLAALGG